MTGWKNNNLKMYLLLKMMIFRLVILVFGGVFTLPIQDSRFFRPKKKVARSLLLGDAAHSTGGTLGQGANSALMDAVVLDELLKATPGRSVVEDVGSFDQFQLVICRLFVGFWGDFCWCWWIFLGDFLGF